MNPHLAAMLAASLGLAAPLARAQPAPGSFPTRPIRMIVPYVPGGPTDILGRSIAQSISEAFGQAVLIDNRAGAAGNVGTLAAARAAPDGYTLITLPMVKAGRLRALAVTGPERSPLMPELPTMAEAGLKAYAVNVWFGLLAPAGTPRDIVNRVSAEVARSVRTPATHERLTTLGAEPVGNTPEQFAAFLKSEIARWAEVVRSAGIRGS